METKQCTKCGEIKSIDNFYTKMLRGKPYIDPCCKSCTQTRNKNWMSRNLDKVFQIKTKYENKIKENPNIAQVFGTKSCSICGLKKELSQFYARASAPDGRRSECKSCFLESGEKRTKVFICSKCGVEFIAPKNSRKGNVIFCSLACRNGHPVGEIPMMEITCVECGKVFLHRKLDGERRKYCSNWCRLHGKHFWTVGKKKTQTYSCKNCGNNFVPTRALQNYCSPQCTPKSSRSKTYTNICCVCDSEYETLNKNSKVCSQTCSGRLSAGATDNPAIISKYGYRDDLGHSVRSSWEANIARWILSRGYSYEYEKRVFHFEAFSYIPDFYIPELDLYIEVKGYWREDARRKTNRFIEDYPNTWIIDGDQYEALGFNRQQAIEFTISECVKLPKVTPYG